MMNSKKKGYLRYMIYKGGRNTYTAVCLDLALIRQGRDSIRLMKRMNDLSFAYVRNVIKHKLDDALLNQSGKLPKKYVLRYNAIVRHEQEMRKNVLKERAERTELTRKWQDGMNTHVWQKPTDPRASLIIG